MIYMDYCKQGHEFEVVQKDKLCLSGGVKEIMHFKCKLCGKFWYTDLQERELDWEGLR